MSDDQTNADVVEDLQAEVAEAAETDVAEDAAERVEKAEAESEDQTESPKKHGRRWPIVLAIIVVIVAGGGIGFYFWHSTPGFCNAICHTPMDPYVQTFSYNSGAAGVDKWGNDVADAGAMMAVSHKEAGVDCLGCHVPTLGEQISEGISWVTGNYQFPLAERTTSDLVQARGLQADEFCLNSNCHHVTADGTPINTREDLIAATANYARNPHVPQHQTLACSDCHKAHRASINACSQCHNDAPIPTGWLTVSQANRLNNPTR